MKYTQEQFEEICAPLSTDLSVDLSLGPADSYDLQSLSRLCANRITTHLDWSVLGARLHLQLIRKTAGKTFSESTNKLGIYLDQDYLNYIIEHKDELNKIPKEENSENRHAIAVGVVDKSYLLKYNKCNNCKQDCPECETFYVGETFEQMYMRIATFVCRPLNDTDKTGSIEMIKHAYKYLSDNVFSCATPTMYNAGTSRPQCASCFVKTIEDSLHSIEDNWMYTGEISRNSGGIGTDVSKIRHSQIGNAGKSDGVPALLKPYESILVYVDQSKKRKGSAAFYLATWHVDIEEFIMMKVPVGNQKGGHARNKCEDLFYSAWIPDIFMERARDDGDWTLFCPKRCPGLTEVWGKELDDLYLRYEREGKGVKTVKARSILHLLFEAQCKKGVPYMCFSDRFNECNMQKNIGVIRSSNLCVDGNTYILTEKGQKKIKNLKDQTIDVWNGQNFTTTTIQQTGENQDMMEIIFSNGSSLKCTPYHKFYIQKNVSRHTPKNMYTNPKWVEVVEAKDLTVGMKLIKTEFPIVETDKQFPYAYTHGAFCGDGTYEGKRNDGKLCGKKTRDGLSYCGRHLEYEQLIPTNKNNISDTCIAQLGNIPRLTLYDDKKKLVVHLDIRMTNLDQSGRLNCKLPLDLPQKFKVPLNCCIQDKLEWFAGYCDMDGTISRNGTNESLQVGSIHKEFLVKIMLMLQTLGCDPKVTQNKEGGKKLMPNHKGGYQLYECKNMYRLLVNSNDLQTLVELGFSPKRLQITTRQPQRNAKRFITVTSTKHLSKKANTYCFKEEERGMGIFNGVITGQCSEISLHTSDREIASCNLASLCLSKFINDKKEFDYNYLGEVTRFVVRFMNNIIDRNYYPDRIPQIKYANLKNRPLGIGIQGLANVFAKMELLFDSEEARQINDKIMQTIYYYAVDESANLAQEHGSYPAFEGSPYSKGLLHPDIWRAPNGERAQLVDCYNWATLRIKASKGMRNSTLIALMPTATSSIIAEQSPCFEPFNFIIGSKSLISGQYTVVCKEFVEDMQKLGVWNDEFSKQIFYDPDNNIGSVQNLKMPESIKGNKLKEARWTFLLNKYRTAYEIGARESIKQGLQRTPFVCQSQSINWFVGQPNFKKWYKNVLGSWERGAKTCMYYMRGNSSMKARAAMACEGCTG